MPFDKSTYDKEYAKEHIKRKHIPFNTSNPDDSEMLEWLAGQENVTKYLKVLIRADMECARCEYWKGCTKCIHEGDSLSKR